MQNKLIVGWKATEGTFKQKTRPWYWAVGIIAGGMAAAAVITADYLFALIAILAGFSVMLVGSRRPSRMEYALYENDILIGKERIPYEKIRRFAIKETDPKMLTLEMKNIVGIASMQLANVDWRLIRTELKNRNIDEVESIDAFVSKVTEWMGL